MQDKIEYIESKKEEEKQNKKSNNRKKIPNGIKFALVILLAFTLGLVIMYAYTELNPKIITKNKTISETKVTDEAMEDAIKKVYDSVLCIEVMNSDGSVLSTGTGFVYSKDSKYGYVLTNAHVVSSGNNIVGVLSNNNTTSLTVLGSDTYTDLAVLRMDVKDVLGVASIGNSKNKWNTSQ